MSEQGPGSRVKNSITAVLKGVMDKHGQVIFGGDGYSQEWHQEAEKRGLPNLRTSAEYSVYSTSTASIIVS